MKRIALALALLAVGYAAGTLAPHASADDLAGTVVSELRGIRSEIHSLTAAIKAHK